MKTAKLLLSIGLSLAGVAATNAQVPTSPARFSPMAHGYMQRARTMTDEGNFAGVIDQLRHLDTQMVGMSPEMAEEYTYLLANAYFERGDEQCLGLLMGFCETYPASPRAVWAALKIGDYYFFNHNWPDALEAYDAVDIDRLTRDPRQLYSYRKALAMIKTGHYREARPLIDSLRDNKAYADAYNFYDAYLDYIDGRFKEAYEGFRKVTPGVPGLDAGYYMTQIEYTWGRYDDVITHGRSLLRKQPIAELAPEIHRIVGLSYFKTNEPDVAYGFLLNYLEQTEATPSADALYALGAIEYSRGEYEAAMRRFEPLADEKNDIGQGAQLYLGQCYLKTGNPSAAALAFEKAARMGFDPKVSETALYNYVTALTQGGKVPFSSSSQLLEQFVATYPDSEYASEVESYLATAYYNDRNYAKALQYIDAIRQPTDAQLSTRQKILYELGIEEMTNGKSVQAVGHLQQAVALKKQDRALAAQASLWLGDALFSLGRFGEAQKAYEGFVGDKSARQNRALGLYDLAYAKYKQKNYAGAAADFASALAEKPALAANLENDALIRMGDCLYYTGRYSEAVTQFSRAIDNGANDADYALYRRARLRGLQGDSRARIADLTKLEKELPNSRWLSKSLLEQALAYEEAGRKDLAADAYKKRLTVAGADVDIDELLRMAAAMHQSGRSADLLEVVERIRHAGGLEADEMAEISLYEADALKDLGRAEQAMAIYKQLAQTPTSLPGSKSAVTIAEYSLEKGDYEGARALMEEFTETGTPHQYWLARGFIALADAYHGLGEKSLAREYLSSLRDNYPGKDDDIDSLISTRLKKWK